MHMGGVGAIFRGLPAEPERHNGDDDDGDQEQPRPVMHVELAVVVSQPAHLAHATIVAAVVIDVNLTAPPRSTATGYVGRDRGGGA